MIRSVLRWSTLAVLGMSVGFIHVVHAHHSFAMFDKEKFLTLEGTVRKVSWRNPHIVLYIDVTDDKGEKQTYALEGSSPNELGRWGWKKNSVKAGDAVSVGMFPLRNDEPGGLIFSVTLPNGSVMKPN